jgi:hypothetical protein
MTTKAKRIWGVVGVLTIVGLIQNAIDERAAQARMANQQGFVAAPGSYGQMPQNNMAQFGQTPVEGQPYGSSAMPMPMGGGMPMGAGMPMDPNAPPMDMSGLIANQMRLQQVGDAMANQAGMAYLQGVTQYRQQTGDYTTQFNVPGLGNNPNTGLDTIMSAYANKTASQNWQDELYRARRDNRAPDPAYRPRYQ